MGWAAILPVITSLLGNNKQSSEGNPMGYSGVSNSVKSILGQRPAQMTAYPETSESSSSNNGGGGMNTILESILGQIGKSKTREYGLNAESPYVQNYLQNYKFGR